MSIDTLLNMRYEWLTLLLLVLLLMAKIFSGTLKQQWVILFVNLSLVVILSCSLSPSNSVSLFGGMFESNPLIDFEKALLVFATLLISLQANYGLKQLEHYIEYYLILISVLLGMMLMISSGHLLMFYLGLEMATIPLAALTAFDFGNSRSSEGAAKFILTSAFSSAVLLFGVSLLYGVTGVLTFSGLSVLVSVSPLALLAFSFIVAGFLFKLSIVPFHLWTADVYEGAPVSVTSFLSVVSKAAAVFIFTTVLYKVFWHFQSYWTPLLVCLSIITMITGNLFAMRQENIKRFFAFSSITQAGFILITLASVSVNAIASSVYFILIYIFSNIAAFTVVEIISQRTGHEKISDYKGLYKNNRFLSIAMMLAVFSLAGIPPTAGFFGKLFLLASGASAGLMVLVIIASLNMVISLYYYLRVVKIMFVDEPEQVIEPISTDIYSKLVLFITLAGILITGFVGGAFEFIQKITTGI